MVEIWHSLIQLGVKFSGYKYKLIGAKMKSLLILVSVFLIANTSVFAEITEHIDDEEVGE